VLRFQPQLPDRSSMRETLRGILARPEFAGQDELPRAPGWWDQLLQRIGRWLQSLGVPSATAGSWVVVLATVLLIALVSGLVYLVVRWAWGSSSRLSLASRKSSEPSEDELGHAGLLSLARAALERGDLRQAIRLRFKATLRRAPQDSASTVLTNSQLQRRISRQFPSAGGPLGLLIKRFEDIWYGGMECSRSDYDSVDIWAREVEAAMPAPDAAASDALLRRAA
jgi:hypothetical protein